MTIAGPIGLDERGQLPSSAGNVRAGETGTEAQKASSGRLCLRSLGSQRLLRLRKCGRGVHTRVKAGVEGRHEWSRLDVENR